MRPGLLRLVAPLLGFVAAACADHPTAPSSIPGNSPLAACYSRPDGTIYCDPQSPRWDDCDPWMELDWCEDDGGTCMTSVSEDPGDVTPQRCPGGGGGGGNPPDDPPPADTACKTSDSAVLNDASVQAGFEDLWNQSGINLDQSQRLESAAWIVQNPDGSRQFVAFSYSKRTACEVNGNFFAPPGAVAFVHTHPFTTGERMTACGPMTYEAPDGQSYVVVGRDGQPLYHRYNNEPSPRDRDLLQNVINQVRKARGDQLLEGYVIDNERITRYVGMNGDKDQSYGRCGY